MNEAMSSTRCRLQLPQSRSELVTMKERLNAVNAPAQHAEHIDVLLRDGDAGVIDFAPEPIASQKG